MFKLLFVFLYLISIALAFFFFARHFVLIFLHWKKTGVLISFFSKKNSENELIINKINRNDLFIIVCGIFIVIGTYVILILINQ
jgi:hypothetical protein